MFDLDRAMSDWRRQMLAAGVKAPEALEELELHLRQEIEQQTQSGVSARQAFESAALHIGTASALSAEFKKINGTTRSKQMKRTLAILAALFGTVFGGAMVLPALARWRNTGALLPGPLLAGSALVIIAACALIYGVRTHRGARGRKLISAFTIAAAAFYVVPLIQAFFLRKTDLLGWIFCGLLAGASILFYGSCLYLIQHQKPGCAQSPQNPHP
jgi:hypothetical protein